MRKIMGILVILLSINFVGCGKGPVDLTHDMLQSVYTQGEDLTGTKVKVSKLKLQGDNIWKKDNTIRSAEVGTTQVAIDFGGTCYDKNGNDLYDDSVLKIDEAEIVGMAETWAGEVVLLKTTEDHIEIIED